MKISLKNFYFQAQIFKLETLFVYLVNKCGLMSINIAIYRKDLLEGNIRTNGMCKNPTYRKINVDKSNVERLLSFDDELSVKNYSVHTRKNYLTAVTSFIEYLGKKSFNELKREDILKFFAKLKDNGLKESSINAINSRLSKFLFWHNGGKYPKYIEGLKPKRNNNIKLPKDIPTEEEVKKLIEAADNPRDKAIVSVLYESGCRIQEFMNMKIGDLRFDDFGCKIIVSGKTGDRGIRLVNSVPILKIWLKCHPNRNDEDAPLWVDTLNKKRSWNQGKPLHYTGINRILKRLQQKAKIEKNIHPHILRHARLTEVAQRVPESILRRFAGWTDDSSMVKIYVHYDDKAVDEVLLKKLYGKISEGQTDAPKTLQPIVCNRCKTENPVAYDYCLKCYYPLTEKAFDDFETVKKAVGEVLLGLLANKNVKKELPLIVKQVTMKKESKINPAEYLGSFGKNIREANKL